MNASTPAVSPKTVAVIGGGVAGIAASVAMADAGLRVQLFEKRPLLGGRASSFFDPQTGEATDACQHGTMRCCTNLADLLERLGVADQIRYHDAIHFLDSEGKRSVIKGSRLPAPGHTAVSFLRFGSLGMRDKVGIARGMLAILRARPEPKWDETAVDAWFRQTGQTERAVNRFWAPVLVSACNESMDRIACTHAFKIFRDGFLAHPTAFEFGVPRVPLGTLYTEPAVAFIHMRSGCVRTRTIVDQLHLEDSRVTGITLQDGERVEADHYVSALQLDLLLKLLPPELVDREPYFSNLRKIELSPLIGVHLWFDREIDCPEALALLDRDSDWIFNKTLNFDRPKGEASYLSVVISARRDLTALDKEEVLRRVLADVHAALPATQQATLLKWNVLKERKGTFSPKPGVDGLRPDQRSPISNLYVAGEWTRTGWPSTMESAARSGYLAAEYVLADAGVPQRYLAPDLPVSGLARWLVRSS
jgi:squalene-associated FAD-dependent desaturase